MVKTLGPLFSLAAEGSLANCLSYVNATFGSYAKVKSFRNITTLPGIDGFQTNMRTTVELWQRIKQSIKSPWDLWAHEYQPWNSGYNSFVSYYLSGLNDGLSQSIFPPT